MAGGESVKQKVVADCFNYPALIGGYFALAKYQSWWPFGTKEIDTTNWQTYRNEQFGYEFKYPINWKVNYEVDFDAPDLTAGDIDSELTLEDNSENPDTIFMSRANFFEPVPNKNSLESYIAWIKEWEDFRIEKEIPVGGGVALYGVRQINGVNQDKSYREANIATRDNVYSLRYATSKNTSLNKQGGVILEILSTFKFIKPKGAGQMGISNTENTNWKTYVNTHKDFSIQYPSDWSVRENGNMVDLYGLNADLASINVKYHSTLNDLPLNPVTSKPYDYFDQYISDPHFFKNHKQTPLNDGGFARSATSVSNPATQVMLSGGNGHFYEISYQPRYNQTLEQLEQILSTFKFIK